METGNEQLFEYLWIRLNGFPIFTSYLKLQEFIKSITIGSTIHPSIALPVPKSIHLVRVETDISAHALLKFDCTLGRSEEEADARMTEILEACDRLKIAELSLPTTVATPKIEPILVCPTEPIELLDPNEFISKLENKPIESLSFSPDMRLPRPPISEDRTRSHHPSKRFKPSAMDLRYDSPKDYSNDDQLNDIEFVRKRYELAKHKRSTYMAAERLRRIRSMPFSDRLKQ